MDKCISEEELKAYIRCSEYFSLGGQERGSLALRALTTTFEVATIKILRNFKLNFRTDIHSKLLGYLIEENKQEQLIDQQLDRIASLTTIMLRELFDLFSFDTYIPVMGKITPSIRVCGVSLRLNISGIFRTKANQTIHAVTFSNLYTDFDICHDPLSLVKIEVLKHLLPINLNRKTQVVLHTFYATEALKLKYYSLPSNSIKKNRLIALESLMKNLYEGYHYPLVPCPYLTCRYRRECKADV